MILTDLERRFLGWCSKCREGLSSVSEFFKSLWDPGLEEIMLKNTNNQTLLVKSNTSRERNFFLHSFTWCYLEVCYYRILFVSLGCCNKLPYTGYFIKNRNLLLTVLEVAILKLGCQNLWVLERAFSRLLISCIPVGQKMELWTFSWLF